MVADLDAGPVTIALPDAGKRFMGLQVVNEDQYTRATYYGAGSHTVTRKMMGTRYAIAVVRFLVNDSNKEDVEQVHLLQDAVKFSQERPGTFEIPNWDEVSLKKVQAALLQLGTTVSDTRRMFGASEDQVDPVTIQFGGCNGKIQNCLPITQGWNYTVRLFRPRAEIIDGTWLFPLSQPEN